MNIKSAKHLRIFLLMLMVPTFILVVTLLHLQADKIASSYGILNIAGSRKDQVQTMLISFGRSGSSFTSDIIAHHPDVFYTFEPLSFMPEWRLIEEKFGPHHLNMSYLGNFSKRVIDSYLSCSFDQDTLVALTNHHNHMTNSTKKLAECLSTQRSSIVYIKCYLQFIEKCQSHRMTFVKTIRFPVKSAHDLMVRFPKLKLIYLVRDPRPTLLSESRVLKWFDFHRDVGNFSALHCRLMGKDLKNLRQLRDRFPGRVKVVRYEHGARDPQGYAEELYKFLGLQISQDLFDFVKYLTSPVAEKIKQPQVNSTEYRHVKRRAKRDIAIGINDTNQSLWIQNVSRHNIDKTKPVTNFGKAKPVIHLDQMEQDANAKHHQVKSNVTNEHGNIKPGVNASRVKPGSTVKSYKVNPDTNAKLHEKNPLTDAEQPKIKQANSSSKIHAETQDNQQEGLKGKRKNKHFSTHRDDPIKAMEHWRHEIGFEAAQTIDAQCGHLYQQLGYRPVTTHRDLVNTAEISMVVDPHPDDFI